MRERSQVDCAVRISPLAEISRGLLLAIASAFRPIATSILATGDGSFTSSPAGLRKEPPFLRSFAMT